LKVPTRYEAKLTEKWKEFFDMMLVRLTDREREPAQGHPMSQPMVSCNIQEIEPGWTCIYFTQPPRLKRSRLHTLLNFVEKWKHDNPAYRIEQIQVVRDGKQVRGINLFWTLFEHLLEQPEFQFTLDPEVRSLYGHEYIEAIMQNAQNFLAEKHLPGANVLLVSRRHIASILLQRSSRGFVTTFQKFFDSLSTSPEIASVIEVDFARWLNSDEQGCFCVRLPEEFDF
jgi:hypothetical protein